MIRNKHIKQTIIYAFICVYSFVLLKPVMPVVNDLFAHTFYKMQHLATVHYENGKHHLHVELSSKTDQKKEDSKGNVPSSIYETLANHIGNKTEELNIKISIPLTIIPYKTQHILDVFIKNPTPPPQA